MASSRSTRRSVRRKSLKSHPKNKSDGTRAASAKSTSAKTSSKTLTEEERAARAQRRRRWVVLGVLPALTLLIVVLMWPRYCFAKAADHVEVLNMEAADAWLRRASWLGQRADESLLLRSRLVRRKNDAAETERLIKAALAAGLPEERFACERILIEAGRGEPARIPQNIDLLIEHEQPDTIFESWIHGELTTLRTNGVRLRCDQWEETAPDDSRPHLYRQKIYDVSQSFTQSYEELQKAIAKRPDSGWAWYELGRNRFEFRDYEGAIESALRAAEHLEVAAPALVLASRAYRENGQFDEAEAVLSRAEAEPVDRVVTMYVLLGQRPSDGETAIATERAYLAMAADRPEDALEFFNRVIAAAPTNYRERNGRAQALRQLGRRDEAAADLQFVQAANESWLRIEAAGESLSENPRDIDAQLRFGVDVLRYEDVLNGQYWLGRVLEDDPDNQIALTALVEYFEQVDTAEGRRQLESYRSRLDAAGGAVDLDAFVDPDSAPPSDAGEGGSKTAPAAMPSPPPTR